MPQFQEPVVHSQLIIVRHGQSAWNLENRFTGWVDVDLSEKGCEEARLAGEKLKGYVFNSAFTSALIRAQHTLTIILEVIGQQSIPVFKDRALNERMYGDLQGLNKQEIKEKYGEQQFNAWRRSYAIAPPNGESLKQTGERAIPYYQTHIMPLLVKGETILVSAHGNSLRALMMFLEHISESDIEHTEIATGIPRLYKFNLINTGLELESVNNL